MNFWQRAYESAWHIPFVPWCSSFGLLVWLAIGSRASSREPSFRRWLLVFAGLIALDAWLTGPLAPTMRGSAATFFSVAFVILGDFRFFFLVLAAATRTRRPFVVALALSFVVPVGSQALRVLLPAMLGGGRALFLAYEAIFLLILTLFVVFVMRRRNLVTNPRLLRALVAYEAVQYTLWVVADVVILGTRSDVGFALRFIPNLAYYAGYVWFAARQMERSRS